jgi:hypothetical protein
LKRLKGGLRKMRAYVYEGSIPTDHFPWVDDYENLVDKAEETIERRSRVLMRGVKIGQRKGGIENKMSIFDTKKSPAPKV